MRFSRDDDQNRANVDSIHARWQIAKQRRTRSVLDKVL